MKTLEIGDVFERDDAIYQVIGTIEDERIIVSRTLDNEKSVKKYDVERSDNFQDSIKPVGTIDCSKSKISVDKIERLKNAIKFESAKTESWSNAWGDNKQNGYISGLKTALTILT